MNRSVFLSAFLPIYHLIKKLKPDWCKLLNKHNIDVYGSAQPVSGNFIFRLIFKRFFKRTRFEFANKEALNTAKKDGTIVYVIRQTGQLEYNFFQHLFDEQDLPRVSFINGISVKRFMPWSILKSTLILQFETIDKYGGIPKPLNSGFITDLIEKGKSVVFSVVPTELEDETVLLSYSQKLILSAVKANKKNNKPVYLVPLEFIWDRRPPKKNKSLIDILFGEKENPGVLRKIVLFWRKYRYKAVARVGEPVSLDSLIEDSKAKTDKDLSSKIGRKLLELMRYERRSITGPMIRSKSWFVERILIDDFFQQTLCEMAGNLKQKADDLRELSKRYLLEISADVNYTYIEIAEKLLKWAFSSLYSGLIFNEDGLVKVKKLYASSPVIFVPNHKSHFDYLILSYILHNNYMTPPYVAAGLNLAFWPLGPIFRGCGAFFIRRTFNNNRLYKLCVETYLRVLLEEGYSQEVFIEGGRSRTGKLLVPKHGIIKMLIKAFDAKAVEDINFVPVSFTYGKVIEQPVYEKELLGKTKKKEKSRHVLKLLKYLKKRKPKYGKIYVNFGEPISYKDNQLGSSLLLDRICREINTNIVVTPQSILAAALLISCKKGESTDAIMNRASQFLNYLKSIDVEFSEGLKIEPKTVLLKALAGFVDNKFLVYHNEDTTEPFYTIDEEKRLQLDYFKNGCIHFFLSIGIISNLIEKRAAKENTFLLDNIENDYNLCSKLLKYEFHFGKKEKYKSHIDKVISYLLTEKILIKEQNVYRVNESKKEQFINFSGLIKNFFESLYISLNSIKRSKVKRKTEKDLVKDMIGTGKNMFLLGHIRYREAVSKANFANNIKLFCDFGILSQNKNSYSSLKNNKLEKELQAQVETLI